jgi:hypothetical protein
MQHVVLQLHLKEKGGNHAAKLKNINKRIATDQMPRAPDFNLPRSGGNYVPDHSQVQAKEHRNVMQILPHILADVDDELTELACM